MLFALPSQISLANTAGAVDDGFASAIPLGPPLHRASLGRSVYSLVKRLCTAVDTPGAAGRRRGPTHPAAPTVGSPSP